MSFKDDIRLILHHAHFKSASVENSFERLINDLAEALTNSLTEARVETPLGIPNRRNLLIGPKYRPARMNMAMSFWIEEDGVIVLAEREIPFTKYENFENFLKTTIRHPEFIERILIMENEAKESVDAYLRINNPYQVTKNDLLLRVEPAEQKSFAETKEGNAVELAVPFSHNAGAGIYDENLAYRFLNSAGILLEVTSTDRIDVDKIQILGRRINSAKVNSSAYTYFSDSDLRDVGIKLYSALRGLVSIYRRDKRALDAAPDEAAQKKILHYAENLSALQEYILDQYAMNRVEILEYKREAARRLQARTPEEPRVDFYRPNDPIELDQIADYLKTSAMRIAPLP